MRLPRKIAIIGLGLLGGSLGLFFRKRVSSCEVIGLSRSVEKIRRARAKGTIDWGSTKAREVLPHADFIFVCTPVSKIPFWIRQAERWARAHCVVTDVGSTKGEILRWVERRHLKNIRFVGSHPMAGSHRSGIEFASEHLFAGSLTFVTRTARTHLGALRQVVGLWRKVSDRVVVLDPMTHDQIVAEISHVPHAVAALLVLNTARRSLSFAGPGFLDSTRISQGDPRLWQDIFLSNRSFLVKHLIRHQKALQTLIRALQSRQHAKVFELLKKASKVRSSFAQAK